MDPMAYILALISAFCNATFFTPNRYVSLQFCMSAMFAIQTHFWSCVPQP